VSPKEERGRAEQWPESAGADDPVVTREIAAEAAVWIARLHGPDRSNHMERECRAWQARSAAHRLAFERGTDLWMDAAGVNRAAVARAEAYRLPEVAESAQRMRPWPFAAALTMAVLAGVLVLGPWWDGDRYDTGIGEQRIVMLQDGTRMTLNTSTRVRVSLGASRRTVDVVGGEALFEVAKDASRPFVVRAASSEVTATGTAFLVRYTPSIESKLDALEITLVEGRVVVSSPTDGVSAAVTPAIEMSPGQRLRVAGVRNQAGAPVKPKVDHPRVDQVLAWKRGDAVFDNASLAEAVAEMNRYSSTPISVIGADALGALRVSGVFKTGDNASFSRAVAKLHGLLVRELPDRLELLSQ